MNDESNSPNCNISLNDHKQELVMRKGWPDGYDEAHVEWLSWDEMLDYQVEFTLTRNKHLSLLYFECKVPYCELLDNNSHLECQNEYRWNGNRLIIVKVQLSNVLMMTLILNGSWMAFIGSRW